VSRARDGVDADALLHRLAPAAHHDVPHGAIGQVVALIEQIRLPLHDSGLLGFVSGLDAREWQCRQRPLGEVGRQGIREGGKAEEKRKENGGEALGQR